nr:MAG: polyprotein 2 [Picornavirales sp.]
MTKAIYDGDGNAPWKSYDFPQAILTNSLPVRDKLGNFKFFRADLEFEIKVNANQFQQGSLLIVYNPYVSYVTKFRQVGTRFLPSLTSLPHTILSLESGNSVKMSVPYANIYDYFDLSDVNAQFGTVQVFVLTTLRGSSSSEKVSFAVFARFTNPEWYTPTAVHETTRKGVVENIGKYAGTHAEAQEMISALRKKFGMKLEAEGEGDASLLGNIGNAIGSLPGLEPLGKVISWTSRAASGVASIFGFSKPVDTVLPLGVVSLPGRYMANTEGKDYSTTLAMIADNAVDGSSMIPSDVDEMSISVLTSRPNIISRQTITSSQFVSNKRIFFWEVSPFHLESIADEDGAQNLCLGTFAYTSMLYRYWRGTIHYSLKIIKTAYHSGRFVVVFFPGGSRGDSPQTLTDEISTCYNVIFDLKEKNDDGPTTEYNLEIPYVSNQPWKRTLNVGTDGALSANTAETATGFVAVYALTDLIFPDTVSSSIDMLLEVKGGSDYQLAVPSVQIASGFGKLKRVIINDFVTDVLDGLAWVSGSDAVVGSPITIFQANAEDLLASGIYWKIFLGKTLESYSGIFTTDPIAVNILVDGTTSAGAGDLVFRLTFVLGQCVYAEALPLNWLNAHSDPFGGTMTATSSTRQVKFDPAGLVAQGDSGLLVPKAQASDVTACTMGEYNYSLRALIKRFMPIFSLPDGSTRGYSPHLTTFDQSTGYRVIQPAQPLEVPESHFSLVTNLYRFYVGGSRVKVFARTSLGALVGALGISTELDTIVSDLDITPQVEQSCVINNCLELTVPYYGRTRCYVLGADQVDAQPVSRALLTTVDAPKNLVYEAAADDTAFFFIVGPPVMHYANAGRVLPPTLN